MRRREFIALISGSALGLFPCLARSQQSANVPRIGFLGLGQSSAYASRVEALREGLRDLGYIEGRNITIEFRWTENVDQLPAFATELVRMNVDIIFAMSSTMVEPARRATQTIPIVFCVHADPIGMGHVASLARPGGNITGLSMVLTDLVPKQLEILMQVLPQATRIGVLWNPTTPSHQLAVKAVEIASEKLGIRPILVPAQAVDDFEGAMSTFSQERAAGVLVLASPLSASQRGPVADLALKHRLPGMFATKQEVEAGGLMSYGPDISDLYRRSALYIDKILKGAKPADLPVEQPTRFDLVVNLKTAKALGLTIPDKMLALANQVIE